MSAASSYHIPLKFDQTGGLLAVADFIINKAIFANSEWFTQNWFFWMILVYDFHRYSIFMAITSIGIFTLFKNIDKRNISFSIVQTAFSGRLHFLLQNIVMEFI